MIKLDWYKSPLLAFILLGTALAGNALAQVASISLPDAPSAGLVADVDPANSPADDAFAYPQQSTQNTQAPQTTTPNQPAAPSDTTQTQQQKAQQQLRQQEKQRILGIVPNFNTSYVPNAVPLTPKQKFSLAFRSATDPFQFVAAAADAGVSQIQNSFPAYGNGVEGYAKYFGASYADNFDGAILGNAVFPILLKQDPRYFRKGTGTFKRRLLYAISTTVWCRNDNLKWGPNYSNVLGNLAAGGISNIYYPAANRGASLTITRGLTVTAEGAIGSVADEFWPDVARRIFKGRYARLQGNIPGATPAQAPPPATPAQPAPK